MASILLGNVKGPQGDTGATGPKGDTGNAATVNVGSVTTVPYGQNARVTNSGDEHDAVFDFVIPQGRPGEQTTDMQNLTLGSMTEPSEQFPVPAIGETGKVIFGKITKWFSDMSALVATKFNTANVVNNLTTTASGYALDARAGKTLNDAITWKNLPAVTGGANVITLPSGWKEANIRIALGGGNRYFIEHIVGQNFNFNTSSSYNIRDGYYGNSGNNGYVSCTLTTKTSGEADVVLVDAMLTEQDVLASSTMQIRYR